MHTTYSEKCHFSFKISLLSYNYEVLTPDHSLRLRTSRNKTNEGSGQCCTRLASYPRSNRRWIWRTNCKALRVQTKYSCLQVSGLSSAATTCTCENYIYKQLTAAPSTKDRTRPQETSYPLRRSETSGKRHEYLQVCASRLEHRIQTWARRASK